LKDNIKSFEPRAPRQKLPPEADDSEEIAVDGCWLLARGC
jgi:hypothetical protein